MSYKFHKIIFLYNVALIDSSIEIFSSYWKVVFNNYKFLKQTRITSSYKNFSPHNQTKICHQFCVLFSHTWGNYCSENHLFYIDEKHFLFKRNKNKNKKKMHEIITNSKTTHIKSAKNVFHLASLICISIFFLIHK